MKIITVANQKGGSGKTATAAALAHAAKIKGLSVLAVDLDPQANLTFSLKAYDRAPGTFQLLNGAPIEDVIQTVEGIDVISGSVNLSSFTAGTGNALILQNALKKLRKAYDVIIIDTPPTAGVLQYNGLQACTDLIIPIQADAFNIQGLYLIKDTADLFQQRSNPDMKFSGIVVTRYDGRSILSKQFAASIRKKAESMGIPFLGIVREGVAVKEAAATRRNLFEYAPKSKPARDYMEIADAILP